MNYNLLPWRESQALKQRLYRAWALRVGVFLAFLGVMVAIIIFHQRARALSAEAQALSVAMNAAKAKRARAPAGVAMISVHTPAGLRELLHQLFFGMADQVCVTSLHTSGTAVILHGEAPNDVAVSHFLPAWPVGPFFSSLHLQSMNDDAARGVTVFEISGALAEAASENNDDVDA
ncbi:MAG TPA: hypothetical protein VFU82_05690 [Gammaproteobacteria bacterium]|jgi:hypothetical protein|nr:hypothetical protein [Gammaproteobacteria bacterium]